MHSEALVCLLRAHTKLVHCAFGEYRRIRAVLGSKHTHLSFLVPSEKAVILWDNRLKVYKISHFPKVKVDKLFKVYNANKRRMCGYANSSN